MDCAAHSSKGLLTYTDRFLSSLIALISIFRLPIAVVVTKTVVGGGVRRESDEK